MDFGTKANKMEKMDYSTLDGGKRNMQLHSFILSAQLWQIEKQIVSSGKLTFLLWSISLLVERLCSANYEISNWMLGWTCLNIETIHWRCSGDDQWFQIIIVVAKMIGSSQQAQDQNGKAKKALLALADFPAVFFSLCHGTQMKIQVQISSSWVRQSTT